MENGFNEQAETERAEAIGRVVGAFVLAAIGSAPMLGRIDDAVKDMAYNYLSHLLNERRPYVTNNYHYTAAAGADPAVLDVMLKAAG